MIAFLVIMEFEDPGWLLLFVFIAPLACEALLVRTDAGWSYQDASADQQQNGMQS